MSAVPHIVIPVHNRRETTLACLGLLRAQGVTRWARPVVVDDGSTDGTSSAVRELFPEAEVLSGGGDLYWTGATALGMQKAMANSADFVFWLNDDTKPAPGALEELREQASAGGGAAGGVCRLPRSGLPVYAGFLRHPEGLREDQVLSLTRSSVPDPRAQSNSTDTTPDTGDGTGMNSPVLGRVSVPDDPLRLGSSETVARH